MKLEWLVKSRINMSIRNPTPAIAIIAVAIRIIRRVPRNEITLTSAIIVSVVTKTTVLCSVVK
jgi:hypothetical protein